VIAFKFLLSCGKFVVAIHACFWPHHRRLMTAGAIDDLFKFLVLKNSSLLSSLIGFFIDCSPRSLPPTFFYALKSTRHACQPRQLIFLGIGSTDYQSCKPRSSCKPSSRSGKARRRSRRGLQTVRQCEMVMVLH